MLIFRRVVSVLVSCLGGHPILEDSLVRQFISFKRRDYVERGRHYALGKVLSLTLKHAGAGSVEELLNRFRGSNDIHLVLQPVINALSEQHTPKYVHFLIGLLKDFLEFYDVELGKAWKKIELPKKAAVRVDRCPSIAEIQKIILNSHSERVRVLIQLLCQTGLRLGEALRLKVGNIDFANKVIRLSAAATKSGESREIPLCGELAETLRGYLEKRSVKSDWLFPSHLDPKKPMSRFRFYKTYYEILRRLHLDGRDPSDIGFQLRPHNFRKFFKTQLERSGVNRLLIERWSGRDVGVQGLYYLPTGDDLRREFEKAERALTIFGKTEAPKPELDSRYERLLARNQLITLKLIENQLIHEKIFAVKQHDRVKIAEIEQKLANLRERMAELTNLLPREELANLDQLADEVS
jgi:integrase